jgi:hypothetical protein
MQGEHETSVNLYVAGLARTRRVPGRFPVFPRGQDERFAVSGSHSLCVLEIPKVLLSCAKMIV